MPRPAKIGDGDFTIRAIRRDGDKNVVVDVAAQTPADLFVEGPKPDWSLPIPRLTETLPSGLNRYTFELDGVPPAENPSGATLKVTLVGGDQAFEYTVRLD